MKSGWIKRVFSQHKGYYEILNLSVNAQQNQVKTAYHVLAKKFHPDSAEGDEEAFKKITEAYEVLKNEEKRAEYNRKIQKPSKTQTSIDPNSVRSSEKDHKRYTSVFQSNSWSGGSFSTNPKSNTEANPELKPSDLIMKMATYSLAAASISFLLYLSYLFITPIEKPSEKLTRPTGLITKLPDRSPAKDLQ